MPDDALPPPAAALDRGPRKQDRAARRAQLIEATISVLATHGYARTTLTEVARRARLSHGLVNFHFASKEGLLAETLRALSDEYRQNWLDALAAAPPGPAPRLHALLMADFEPRVCAPDRLAAWCAFWGEAQSRPLYQDNCSGNDEEYVRIIEGLCADLAAEGGYPATLRLAARVLRVTTEGVWLDLMTMREPYGREEAIRTVLACCAAFFPRHFTEDGLRPPG